MTEPNSPPFRPDSNRTQGSPSTRLLVAVVVVLVSGILVSVYVWDALSHPGPAGVPTPPPPTVIYPPGPPANANLTALTAPPILLSAGQLGVDLRADQPLTSDNAAAINATGARLVRWPGGALGDRFDPLADSDAGLIYNDSGVAVAPATTFAQFVTWCGWVRCESIVTLPAEIDEPSLAAQIVSYSIDTLDFHPTEWEIGNEPLMWTHFGIPWSSWNESQDANVTPAGFASVVQQYVSAIRAVDPAAPILGIGGVGAGSAQSTWISDDVATNGPNLSGVAIHVYPAGTIASPEPPATWFASLQGGTALPARVNSTIATDARSCPGCNLSVFVDELGTGTLVPTGDEIGGGYLAAFVTAEIVQSLSLAVSSVDYYDLESSTPGAWFSVSGAPSPAYFAFANWDERVGDYAAPLGVQSTANGLLAAVGGTSPDSLSNLLLVNINSTFTFSLDLTKTFPNVGDASILAWNGSAAYPNNLTWANGTPSNLTVPPMSLAILSHIGAPPPSLGNRSLRDPVAHQNGGLRVRDLGSPPVDSGILPPGGHLLAIRRAGKYGRTLGFPADLLRQRVPPGGHVLRSRTPGDEGK